MAKGHCTLRIKGTVTRLAMIVTHMFTVFKPGASIYVCRNLFGQPQGVVLVSVVVWAIAGGYYWYRLVLLFAHFRWADYLRNHLATKKTGYPMHSWYIAWPRKFDTRPDKTRGNVVFPFTVINTECKEQPRLQYTRLARIDMNNFCKTWSHVLGRIGIRCCHGWNFRRRIRVDTDSLKKSTVFLNSCGALCGLR